MVGRPYYTEDRWTDNILVPSPAWGTGGTATNPHWGIQPSRPHGSISVPWSGVDCAMPAYVRRIQETRAALHAVSVTISIKRIVQSACKVSPLPVAYSLIVWSIGGILIGMISGMSWLISNLCAEFLLVVSVNKVWDFVEDGVTP